MITGMVTGHYEAVVNLGVQGEQGQKIELEVMLDTGYTGALTLPHAVIAHLGLPSRGQARAVLADGSERMFDRYNATVLWDGRLLPIAVDAAEADPLLGMKLMQGYEVTLQVITGGGVRIQALPTS